MGQTYLLNFRSVTHSINTVRTNQVKTIVEPSQQSKLASVERGATAGGCGSEGDGTASGIRNTSGQGPYWYAWVPLLGVSLDGFKTQVSAQAATFLCELFFCELPPQRPILYRYSYKGIMRQVNQRLDSSTVGNDMAMNQFLSGAELQRRANIPESRFNKLVKSGQLKPVMHVGRTALFRSSDLETVQRLTIPNVTTL